MYCNLIHQSVTNTALSKITHIMTRCLYASMWLPVFRPLVALQHTNHAPRARLLEILLSDRAPSDRIHETISSPKHLSIRSLRLNLGAKFEGFLIYFLANMYCLRLAFHALLHKMLGRSVRKWYMGTNRLSPMFISCDSVIWRNSVSYTLPMALIASESVEMLIFNSHGARNAPLDLQFWDVLAL